MSARKESTEEKDLCVAVKCAHLCVRIPPTRRERRERNIQRDNDQQPLNMKENIQLYTQEALQMPSQINSEIHTEMNTNHTKTKTISILKQGRKAACGVEGSSVRQKMSVSSETAGLAGVGWHDTISYTFIWLESNKCKETSFGEDVGKSESPYMGYKIVWPLRDTV